MGTFVPLHIYSGYSYLRSGLIASNIAPIAKNNGYGKVAICDMGSMSGYAPFYHSCINDNVSPIFGFDIEFNEGILSFFIMDEDGYINGLSIIHEASKGRISKDFLVGKTKGLFVICPSEGLSFIDLLYQGDENGFASSLSKFIGKIGEVRIGLPYAPQDASLISVLRSFCSSHSYTPIAFPKICYQKKSDAIILKIVNAIEAKEKIEETQLDGNEYFLGEKEISSYYTPSEIEETNFHVSFEYIKKRGKILSFHNDEGLDSDQYLAKLAFQGLKNKIGEPSKEYIDRLNHELDIISSMGYSDYFLLVSDFINHAKRNRITVGPGRGSSGGSLVSYSLGIVATDPMKYGLLFERFLNPQRQSMPDIDVDVSDIDRDRIITYLQRKYGFDRVGKILTTQTIKAKEALDDVGRVYGYKESAIRLIKQTLVDDKLDLRDNYRKSIRMRELLKSDQYYLNIVSLASKIEGLPRQAGLHAAGVVINDKPLNESLPVSIYGENDLVACLEKDYLEEQGFLKMDLLSLRNLTTIDNCLRNIKINKGIDIEYEQIPYEDEKAISIIAKGLTLGLFQIEKNTSSWAIPIVKPASFRDVMALISLIRPGPSDNIPTYGRRKDGREKIIYPCAELEPILKETYGIIVYQEQIMQISSSLAGFSFAEADSFRRAISKKDASKLISLKSSFISGCIHKGFDEKLGEEIFDLIYKFADYGFNKSHAVNYAVLTCQMAYLKNYYPSEFYASILDSYSASDPQYSNIRTEASQLGVAIKNPSINLSKSYHLSRDNEVIMPLNYVKEISKSISSSIEEERELNGPFTDLLDFIKRLYPHGLKQSTAAKLIDSGSMDCFGLSRSTLSSSLSEAFDYMSLIFDESGENIIIDENMIPKPTPKYVDDDPIRKYEAEENAIGIVLSGSPLESYGDLISKNNAISLSSLMRSKPFNAKIACIYRDFMVRKTRKGGKIGFLSVYDGELNIELVIFENEINKYSSLFSDNAALLINIRKDANRDGHYIVTSISELHGGK